MKVFMTALGDRAYRFCPEPRAACPFPFNAQVCHSSDSWATLLKRRSSHIAPHQTIEVVNFASHAESLDPRDPRSRAFVRVSPTPSDQKMNWTRSRPVPRRAQLVREAQNQRGEPGGKASGPCAGGGWSHGAGRSEVAGSRGNHDPIEPGRLVGGGRVASRGIDRAMRREEPAEGELPLGPIR